MNQLTKLQTAEMNARYHTWDMNKTIQYMMDYADVNKEIVMAYFRNSPNWESYFKR